ncbi:ATP-binding protein [Leptospira wolffii]|uniref:ATP-binding protein n=1 Tax=Leptospira wolffii TaxID=409998 RepID=UPI0002F60B73|nr:ATP-binding protein [Leptospira wolffii]EPG64928.1 GHKL domain protein [Leptospira wolffii serovar Khorat str. Khorat-H2]
MFSFDTKLRFGFLAAGLLTLSIGLFSWISGRQVTESKNWESHTFAVISRLEKLTSVIKESEIHFLNFIATGRPEYIEYYESSMRDLEWNLTDLGNLIRDNQSQILVTKELSENLRQRNRYIREIIKNRFETEKQKTILASIEENGKNIIEALVKRENELLWERTREANRKSEIAEWVVFLSVLFNVFLLILWYKFLRKESGLRLLSESDSYQKNKLLSLILENMADGVVVFDKNESLILSNDKSRKFLEQSSEFLDRLRKLDSDRSKLNLKNGSSEDRIILVNSRKFSDLDGSFFGKVLLLSDISEEESRAFEKERYLTEILMIKTALDCASSSIMIADNDLNIVYTNKSVVNLFHAVQENIREKYPDFTPSRLMGVCIDTFHATPEKQRKILSTFTSEYKSSISIGGREFDLCAAPVIDESGERLGSVVEWLDVTDRNRKRSEISKLNEELTESVAKLEYANRELEAFSYSVSHDLRAPIRGIDGFARIMIEDYSSTLDAEGNRLLNIIASNSKFMGQLIDDLLAFYRVSKVEPRREAINMREMVLDAIEIVTQDYPDEEVLTQVGELSNVKGDPSMLKQVWLNLISNSFKYSAKAKEPRVEIGVINGEREETFFVKDNGAGFNEQYSHKLFKVFQRLHSNEEFQGTGIGLAIVDRIVGRHGGKVWGKGKIGEGATFYFTLPKKD